MTDADGRATLRAVIGKLIEAWKNEAQSLRFMVGEQDRMAQLNQCAAQLDAALAAVLAVRPALPATECEHVRQAAGDLIDDLFIGEQRLCKLPDDDKLVEDIERIVELRICQAIEHRARFGSADVP